MEFTACLLSRADAQGSADIGYRFTVCDAYCYILCKSYSYGRQKVGHTENI